MFMPINTKRGFKLERDECNLIIKSSTQVESTCIMYEFTRINSKKIFFQQPRGMQQHKTGFTAHVAHG